MMTLQQQRKLATTNMIFMRRTALSLLVAATALCPHASDDLRMVVGTYTDTGSDGIYTYVFNQQTGSANVLDSLSLRAPSYLTITRDGRILYALSERPDSTASLSAIRLNALTGHMTLVNTLPTGGARPLLCRDTWQDSPDSQLHRRQQRHRGLPPRPRLGFADVDITPNSQETCMHPVRNHCAVSRQQVCCQQMTQ